MKFFAEAIARALLFVALFMSFGFFFFPSVQGAYSLVETRFLGLLLLVLTPALFIASVFVRASGENLAQVLGDWWLNPRGVLFHCIVNAFALTLLLLWLGVALLSGFVTRLEGGWVLAFVVCVGVGLLFMRTLHLLLIFLRSIHFI